MDSAKVNDWIQVVGIFALIASLIFVGLQLKQSQEIALSQAFQSRSDSTIGVLISSAENPWFVSAAAKRNTANKEALNPEELATMTQYALAILFLNENLHYQYTHGFISENRWNKSRKSLSRFLSDTSPLPVRVAYQQNPNQWSDAFQIVVDELILQIESG